MADKMATDPFEQFNLRLGVAGRKLLEASKGKDPESQAMMAVSAILTLSDGFKWLSEKVPPFKKASQEMKQLGDKLADAVYAHRYYLKEASMAPSLRAKLIRLAHSRPELRGELLPLLTGSRVKATAASV